MPLNILKNITFIHGDILSLLTIPENVFDYIYASLVIHFFKEEHIHEFFKRCYSWLKKDGVLYLTAESSFLSNWGDFRIVYEKRRNEGASWPGLISEDEMCLYEISGISKHVPRFFNFFDENIMRRELVSAGFHVETVEYINRKGELPKMVLFDGREGVIGVGVK